MKQGKTKKVYFVADVNGGMFLSPNQIKALKPSRSGYMPHKPIMPSSAASAVKKASLVSSPSILSVTAGENCATCGKKRRKR